MSHDNSLNPAKGKFFQERAKEVLSEYFNVEFKLDYPIKIGTPPKDHRFDLVSEDSKFVGECKSYSWTKSGYVPSAKMGFVNEAVYYLTFISPKKKRFVVMRRDYNSKRDKTLADYYHSTYLHLLNGISILEYDLESGDVREIK